MRHFYLDDSDIANVILDLDKFEKSLHSDWDLFNEVEIAGEMIREQQISS